MERDGRRQWQWWRFVLAWHGESPNVGGRRWGKRGKWRKKKGGGRRLFPKKKKKRLSDHHRH